MATIYINVVTILSEFGIGAAIISRRDMTERQISQLNSLSVGLGLVGFLVSVAAAVPLGRFFHTPSLTLVIVVMSVGFIVSGFRSVPFALLGRDLRFKLLAAIEGAQGVGQALVTLTLAALGFGAWALVFGVLSFAVIPACLTLACRRQRFEYPRYSDIRRAIDFSRDMTIGRLSWTCYNDSDFIVAGRVLGAGPLGAYTLAWTLAHTPVEKLTTLVGRVAPSVFAKVQSDLQALRRYLKHMTGVLAIVVFPATIGLALVAADFIPLVLGEKWSEAILPLQLLAIHATIRSNVILLTPLLVAIGAQRVAMWNSVLGISVLPVSFLLGSRWGAVGIAAVWVLIYPLLQIPIYLQVFRRIALPRSEYLAAIWPALSGCAVMALLVAGFQMLASNEWPLYIRLIGEIAVGMIAYASAVYLLHRDYVSAVREFVRASRAS